MSQFAQHATELLNVAREAVARGESCTDMTVLIQRDGGIHLLAENDWALHALALHHGAKAVYRITARDGAAQVEGREGGSTCLMRSEDPDPRRFLRQLGYFGR